MCVVSMVIDTASDHMPWDRQPTSPWPKPFPLVPMVPTPAQVVQEKKELWEKYLRLMEAAKEIDEATSQPDCEDSKKLAELERIIFDLAAKVKELQAGQFDAAEEIKRLHAVLGKTDGTVERPGLAGYDYAPGITVSPGPSTYDPNAPSIVVAPSPVIDTVPLPPPVILGPPFVVLGGPFDQFILGGGSGTAVVTTIDPKNIVATDIGQNDPGFSLTSFVATDIGQNDPGFSLTSIHDKEMSELFGVLRTPTVP